MTVIIKGKSLVYNGISYTVLSVSKKSNESHVTMVSNVDNYFVIMISKVDK